MHIADDCRKRVRLWFRILNPFFFDHLRPPESRHPTQFARAVQVLDLKNYGIERPPVFATACAPYIIDLFRASPGQADEWVDSAETEPRT
ncbi:MAG: hypothetical protein DMG70_18580 [Acidobacteria bacterium]|nr:MAG: hypothetical protein DMG70_18580 [Acidobacteriota bacterium]